LRKVEDDIKESSILIAEYQSSRNAKSELCLAPPKLFLQRNKKHREDQNVACLAFTLSLSLPGSRVLSQSVTDLSARPHQFDLMAFSYSCSYGRPDLTTVIVNYCIPKADNCKYLKQKNIPDHVSNNCLVLTYK
jgi:hypothetical protein